jgi:hypothetical protein
MNSLYNNDNFLPEGNRCNFQALRIYGPCKMSYAEPTMQQLENMRHDVHNIKSLLLDERNIYKYCGSIFNYRVGKAESLVKNLYDLFHIILYQKIQLTYSPQFGINLWPGYLSYFRNNEIEGIVQQNVSSLFTDFITETTTFLRYHIKFRYNHLFNSSFKKSYLSTVIKCLLLFASKINKIHVIQYSIKNALDLILINKQSTN